jgi:hypothetical protein
MTATVFERGDIAVILAIEDDRLTYDRGGHRAIARKMMAPAGDTPAIAQKHRRPLLFPR